MRPSFTYLSVAPMVTIFPKRALAYDNQAELKVNCKARGFPSPITSWMRIESTIGSSRVHVNENVLIVKNPRSSDFAIYKCVAVNQVGTSHANTIIMVASKYIVSIYRFLSIYLPDKK